MSDAPAETAPPMARLRGDLTQGPILKTLLAFSIPTLISNLLQTLNGTINSIWVGRLIGNSALAATAGGDEASHRVLSGDHGGDAAAVAELRRSCPILVALWAALRQATPRSGWRICLLKFLRPLLDRVRPRAVGKVSTADESAGYSRVPASGGRILPSIH